MTPRTWGWFIPRSLAEDDTAVREQTLREAVAADPDVDWDPATVQVRYPALAMLPVAYITERTRKGDPPSTPER